MELRPEEDDPEEQRQNADASSLGLHVLTKTKLRPERLRGQVPQREKCCFDYTGERKRENPLFLSEIGFGLGQFGPIGSRTTDLGKFGVERLRSRHVPDCLCGAGGTQ